ncbi:MAG: hypothetical protein ABFD96_13645 [Armatimonadia bacterium]
MGDNRLTFERDVFNLYPNRFAILGMLVGLCTWIAVYWLLALLLPLGFAPRWVLWSATYLLSATAAGLVSSERPFLAGLPPLLLISGITVLFVQGIQGSSGWQTWPTFLSAMAMLIPLAPAVLGLWAIKAVHSRVPARTAVMRCIGLALFVLTCGGWYGTARHFGSLAARERMIFREQVEGLLRNEVFARPISVAWVGNDSVGLAMDRRSIRLFGEGHMANDGSGTRVELRIEARRQLPAEIGTPREFDNGDVEIAVREVPERDDRLPSTPAKLVRYGYLRPEWADRLTIRPGRDIGRVARYTATHRGLTFDFDHIGSLVDVHIYGKGRW